MNVFRLIALARSIEEPPSLDSEELFRIWFRETSDTMVEMANCTGDKKARLAAAMMQVMEQDSSMWSDCYELLLDARDIVLMRESNDE